MAALWPAPKDAALVQVATGSLAVCVEWSTTRELAADATEDEITGVLLAVARRHRGAHCEHHSTASSRECLSTQTTEVIRDQPVPWETHVRPAGRSE